MAYSKAGGKAVLKYDKEHYKKQLLKYLWMFGKMFRSVEDSKMRINLLIC